MQFDADIIHRVAHNFPKKPKSGLETLYLSTQ